MIEIQIRLTEKLNDQQIFELKSFLERQLKENLYDAFIERGTPKEGDMDLGSLLDSIRLVIEAVSKPLTELAKSLGEYVKTYNTELEIETEGVKIKIKTNNIKKVENILLTTLKQKE
jgi:hypothetical protein